MCHCKWSNVGRGDFAAGQLVGHCKENYATQTNRDFAAGLYDDGRGSVACFHAYYNAPEERM